MALVSEIRSNVESCLNTGRPPSFRHSCAISWNVISYEKYSMVEVAVGKYYYTHVGPKTRIINVTTILMMVWFIIKYDITMLSLSRDFLYLCNSIESVSIERPYIESQHYETSV